MRQEREALKLLERRAMSMHCFSIEDLFAELNQTEFTEREKDMAIDNFLTSSRVVKMSTNKYKCSG